MRSISVPVPRQRQLWARLRHLTAAAALGLSRQPWLLIYQMGKVGSQTIEATLRQARLPHRIDRIHTLSPHHGNKFGTWLSDPSVPEPTKDSLRHQLEESNLIYSGIKLRKHWPFGRASRRKIDVVVGVREPVGFVLASVFQNHTSYFASLSEVTVETCRKLLLGDPAVGQVRQRRIADILNYVHDWFEVELATVLGIDVFAEPFVHENGFHLYENALARVLVYRYENFDRLPDLLEGFLGVRPCPLANRNIGVEKEYGELYRRVKQHLRLPRDFLSTQYRSPLARHFYSEEERDRLTAQWSI